MQQLWEKGGKRGERRTVQWDSWKVTSLHLAFIFELLEPFAAFWRIFEQGLQNDIGIFSWKATFCFSGLFLKVCHFRENGWLCWKTNGSFEWETSVNQSPIPKKVEIILKSKIYSSPLSVAYEGWRPMILLPRLAINIIFDIATAFLSSCKFG